MSSTLRSTLFITVMVCAASVGLGLMANPTLAGPSDMDWNRVSHFTHLDRSPLCPTGGQSFAVKLFTLSSDVTSVRIHVDDGSTQWVNATFTGTFGPNDVWEATVPSTTSNSLSYYFELTSTDIDYFSVDGMSDITPTDGGFVVDYVTLSHAPVGATPVSGGTVFKVWAPTRSTVHLRGDFNGWGTSDLMTKVGEYFVLHKSGANPNQQYKYFFNNSHWNLDARGRGIDSGNNSNSIIIDPESYNWTISDFDTPALEDMVIYQVHLGTFAGRNDPLGSPAFPGGYTDLAARVGHLVDLGVNTVLLNPVNEFPGDESAGYNPLSQWAPEWAYGSPNEFKQMVDTFHANGIAVLIDIVWNHFATSGNLMWNYDGSQTYFDTPQVDTPWGAQADFDEPEVFDYYAHNAHMWLEEYKLDGFRMDATDFMNISPQDAAGWALMQQLNDDVDRRWGNKVVIAEQLPDDSYITRPTDLGGAGFDSQYHDAWTDEVRAEIFDGLSSDPEMWKVRNVLDGSGAYLSGKQAVNYIELHDEAWPTSGGQRLPVSLDPSAPHDNDQAKGRTKLSHGLALLGPGVPAFLMGVEWLEDTGFGTGFGDRIDWGHKTTYPGIYQFFKDVIELRTSEDALAADSPYALIHTNEAANVIVFRRYNTSGDQFIIAANFGNNNYGNYRFGVPASTNWYELVNSEDPGYEGTGSTNPGAIATEAIAFDGFAQSVSVNVPPHSIVLFSNGPGVVGIPDQPSPRENLLLLRVSPNPMRTQAQIQFELPAPDRVSITIHDIQGRLVDTLTNRSYLAGSHQHQWIPKTQQPHGIYFARVQTSEESRTHKIVLVP
ncbi:MAG: T9SS type A sorting domain-containing protein [Candidatus Eisenbacteria bacterium]|uniref:1,4-alpha-glucan branching enzyme n=1 Tax=Eiseniibacteriota bacterium TaxID=2212470 RepID=A0A7Y2E5I5_UNCEI|nr:T9SS type A sorting domain-containing protein [Candidatus Eisenbacteria bacterium]